MRVLLQNLTKKFPNRNKKEGGDVIAVNDFNFEIPDGKLIGLLGPSGCGKSTALNLISGLLEPTEGHIFFGEDEVTHLPPENRGVGLVFQNYALYPHMTVLQNIMFPLQNLKGEAKLPREEIIRRATEAAKLVQIDGLLERKPSEMSGGQQQRVAIARALVKMPSVLLLDEPLSNLDARLRLQTREEIRRIQKETGITTIFVTHDQEEAMSISDLIVVMKDGMVQQIAPPQDVYDDPANLFVAKFLGTPAINVFRGEVKGGGLYLTTSSTTGSAGGPPSPEGKVLDVPGVADQPLWVGIRPEGFLPDPAGLFACRLRNVEVMGRDTSVVFDHPAADSENPRAIIASAKRPRSGEESIRFSLDPEKVHLFRKDTEERLYIGEQRHEK